MGVYLPKFVIGSAAALLALSPAIGRSAALELSDELQLSRPVATPLADSGSLLDQEHLRVMEESLTLPVDEMAELPVPKPATDLAGVDIADFNNSVYAVAVRDENGLGLGVASSGGLTLTGGFVTKDGMQISLYYVQRVSEMESAARKVGIEDLPARTVGLTVGWKF